MDSEDLIIYVISFCVIFVILASPSLVLALYNLENPLGFATGHGVSTDTIYGMEQDGIVWKTYSVYLTNDQQMKDPPIYSMDSANKTLVDKIQKYAISGQKVHVYYTNVIFNAPWVYTSDIIIDDVEPVNDST